MLITEVLITFHYWHSSRRYPVDSQRLFIAIIDIGHGGNLGTELKRHLQLIHTSMLYNINTIPQVISRDTASHGDSQAANNLLPQIHVFALYVVFPTKLK